MGGFAFIFGFLVLCVGGLLMYGTMLNFSAYQAIGAALIQAGAIICGSGAISAAILRAGAERRSKQKSETTK